MSGSRGRVALVTGAGQGLGRAHARMLADAGYALVLNDVDPTTADDVVDEVRALGLRAVAVAGDASLMETAERMVAESLRNFDRVDAVIANAGYLRDRSFKKMGADDFDTMIAIHLRGAFNLCKAAWTPLCAAGHGRIVLTTSTSALFGQFGQANYDAAKLGVVGLMNALKLEGERHGIRVNTVAPLAASRLAETVFPPAALRRMDPRWVAAVAAHLASPECVDNGGIFQVGAGRVTRVRLVVDGETALPEACLTSAAATARTLGELAAQPCIPRTFANAPEAVMYMLRD
jgi:NAD(P)-dependent dehydrogenase (short-subunit alcohol dehydrogenase family)